MELIVPSVRFRLPDGRLREVAAGSIVGRLASSALRVDDPRISEAHALLSLRGSSLWWLALRGGVAVDGVPQREVELRPGLRLQLAERLVLLVEAVTVPGRTVALKWPDGRLVALSGDVASILPDLSIEFRFIGDALAHVWSTGLAWRCAVVGGQTNELRPGLRLALGGCMLDVVECALSDLAVPVTTSRGRLHAPIVLRPTFTCVRIEMAGRPPVLIHGVPARILSELCDYSEPVDWKLVAQAVWPDDDDLNRLRRNWDRNLRTLRDRLGDAMLRQDLVLADGHGNIGLHLLEGDLVMDQP